MTTETTVQTRTPKLDAAGLKLAYHSATITRAKGTKAEGDSDIRRFDFTFSSEKPDRHNDVVTQLGIDLKAFRENPVVLWAHNAGFDTPPPPVARVLRTWIREGALMGTVEFPAPGIHAMADTLHGMVSTGFLNAVSIGFRPIETSFDEERNGFNFLRTELVELSLVPVPANASALIEMSAEAKAVDVKSLTEWVEGAQKMLVLLTSASPTVAVADTHTPAPAPAPVHEPVTTSLITDIDVADAIKLADALERAAKAASEITIPKPPEPITVITTPTQPTTGQESELLKGVVKAALYKAAAQKLSYHTGRLED